MPTEVSFQELIRRVRARDQDAATEVVRLYEEPIRRWASTRLRRTRLRRLLDPMDICQSVWASFFVRAALGQYDLSTPERLLKLLATMVRNKVVDAARKPHLEAGSGVEWTVAAPGSTPSQHLMRQELLEKCRAQLSEEERWLADQRAVGREWAEMAAERGESPDALRMRLTRAIDRVAHELALDG